MSSLLIERVKVLTVGFVLLISSESRAGWNPMNVICPLSAAEAFLAHALSGSTSLQGSVDSCRDNMNRSYNNLLAARKPACTVPQKGLLENAYNAAKAKLDAAELCISKMDVNVGVLGNVPLITTACTVANAFNEDYGRCKALMQQACEDWRKAEIALEANWVNYYVCKPVKPPVKPQPPVKPKPPVSKPPYTIIGPPQYQTPPRDNR